MFLNASGQGLHFLIFFVYILELLAPGPSLPEVQVNILFDPSIQAKNFILSKAMRQHARQDTIITQWAQLHTTSPILQHVQKVLHADTFLCASLSHLSQCEIEGQHSKLFDLPPDKVL